MKKFRYIVFFIFCLHSSTAQINTLIQEIITQSASQNASFGISVRGEDGAALYEYNASTRLIPASTFKLITTLTSIELLGSDYRYSTLLGYQGELLKDGTLKGDVVIVGSGDPSLGSHELSKSGGMDQLLQKIITEIRNKGIKCIDGQVLVDDGLFDRYAIHPSWSWDDITNYYASGAWGLNLHDNYYYLSFDRSSDAHQSTKITKIEPPVPGLSVESNVTTGPLNSGDNAYIYGDPYEVDRNVNGTIPPGKGEFTIKGAIPNPPLFAAYHIHKALETEGIKSMGYGITDAPRAEITKISDIESISLASLVAHANAKSDNMYCEAFFKKLGSLKRNKGSFQSAAELVEEHLASKGLPMSEIHIEDGSGLSARNRISPNFMTAFLHAKKSVIGLKELSILLPKVGEVGSVRNFLKGYSAQKSAWLKSGSINNVLAYSGFIELASGELISISVMANGQSSNSRIRKQLEKIIETIYQEL